MGEAEREGGRGVEEERGGGGRGEMGTAGTGELMPVAPVVSSLFQDSGSGVGGGGSCPSLRPGFRIAGQSPAGLQPVLCPRD